MNRKVLSVPPDNFKIAICVNDATAYSQTFVRRHIQTLFEGNTVVVAKNSISLDGTRPIYILEKSWHRIFTRLAGKDRLINFLTQHQIDFVLAEFGPLGIATYQSVKAAGLPMYCYFRGYDASKLLRIPTYVSKLRKMCRNIDGIVAVSDHILQNLHSSGIFSKKSFVIPSGIDTIEFSPAAKRAGSFIAVGRFIEKKAPQVTIRAFARCLEKIRT